MTDTDLPGLAARARQKAAAKTRTVVRIPVIGVYLPGPGNGIVLPDKNALVYAAAIAGLAVTEIIEWPVGAVLIAGHLLSQQKSRSKALAAVEEALADAE